MKLFSFQVPVQTSLPLFRTSFHLPPPLSLSGDRVLLLIIDAPVKHGRQSIIPFVLQTPPSCSSTEELRPHFPPSSAKRLRQFSRHRRLADFHPSVPCHPKVDSLLLLSPSSAERRRQSPFATVALQISIHPVPRHPKVGCLLPCFRRVSPTTHPLPADFHSSGPLSSES